MLQAGLLPRGQALIKDTWGDMWLSFCVLFCAVACLASFNLFILLEMYAAT